MESTSFINNNIIESRVLHDHDNDLQMFMRQECLAQKKIQVLPASTMHAASQS